MQTVDHPWQVIADLERHSSRINKEQIIEAQAQAHNDEFFEGARFALDPMITFGLKQVPEKSDADGPGLPWEAFTLIMTGFVNRSLTGNTGKEVLASIMQSATKSQWNGWYRRILIKDLRCGVSEKTINKVVEKKWAPYAVPVFSCQLAHDSANHESKVSGTRLIEVKLDGVRVITVVYPDGRVDQYSRNGKELVNFPHIKEQFAQVARAGGISEPTVFDGEVMSSSFQDLMKQVHRKSNVKAQDATLNLFDIVPLANFETGKCATKQVKRSQLLKVWHETWEDTVPNITVVGQEMVNLDTVEGDRRFREINQQAIDGGYEGIMIKDPMAVYECKRSTAWLKLKPFIEVSLDVIGLEEGTGKNVGRLGALICQGEDDGKIITTNVGSGFSDELRNEIWKNKHLVEGQTVEIRADAVTQNQDGTYSVRFPRFLRFRGFEVGEKI